MPHTIDRLATCEQCKKPLLPTHAAPLSLDRIRAEQNTPSQCIYRVLETNFFCSVLCLKRWLP